jgi:hypothetical protein
VQKIIPTILLKKLEQFDEEACLANSVKIRVDYLLEKKILFDVGKCEIIF